MSILTPSRLIAVTSLAVAALALTLLGFGVAYAGTDAADTATRTTNKACVHGNKLERNKHNAVAYYETAFNDKNPRLAVELYGGDMYIQHNPLAANGFEAFIAFVEDFTAAFPNVHVDIRRVIAECDLVVTHAVITGAEAIWPIGAKVVDIFRLDAKGKIVEHWDVLSPLSPTSANGNPEV